MRSRILFAAFALIFALYGTGCFRPDIRTVEFTVPQAGSSECVAIIQGALGSVEGLVLAEPNLQTRTIAVTYDSRKLAIKNIEFVITAAGFDCNDSKAKPEARKKLPTKCQ